MDIGLIIAILLQIGFGSAMVIAVRKRKRKNIVDRHPNFWKLGMFIATAWGWLMIVLSTGNLLIYVVLYFLSH